MDGILNIRQLVIIIFITGLSVSCKNDDKMSYQKIVEDNFLKIVDTAVYKYGSFRPSLSSDNKDISSAYLITIKDTISFEKSREKDISSFFNQNISLGREYEDLKNSVGYSTFILNGAFPKKIGKYHIKFSDGKNKPNIRYAGEVRIKNFKFSSDLGYLIVEESEKNSKIAFIVLFRKMNGEWKIVKREPLYES